MSMLKKQYLRLTFACYRLDKSHKMTYSRTLTIHCIFLITNQNSHQKWLEANSEENCMCAKEHKQKKKLN